MKTFYKPKILIDLDGVLNTYKGNFDEHIIPSIKPNAELFLKKLTNKFEVKIFTTRNIQITEKWIVNNKLTKYISGITNTKENAYLIIDDRCICFDGNYKETLNKINNFKVYWK